MRLSDFDFDLPEELIALVDGLLAEASQLGFDVEGIERMVRLRSKQFLKGDQ